MEKGFNKKGIAKLANELADMVLLKNTTTVIALSGSLGSGKTFFAQHLCKALGVKEAILSPTFSMFNQYQTNRGNVLHADLYRIKTINELEAIGFFYFVLQSFCSIIEWPEIALNELKTSKCNLINVEILMHSKTIRLVRVFPF